MKRLPLAFLAASLTALAIDDPARIVSEATGRTLPVALLPRDSSGRIVTVEQARSALEAEQRNVTGDLMARHFPDGVPLREERAPDGSTVRVPDASHPNYRAFEQERRARLDALESSYRDRFGSKFEAFATAVFSEIVSSGPASVSERKTEVESAQEDVHETVRELLRKEFDQPREQEWKAVARDTGATLSRMGGAVADRIGTLGGYAALADEALMAEASGKSGAVQHAATKLAAGLLKEKASEAIVRRFPGAANALEIINLPGEMFEEMGSRMDAADAAGTSRTAAQSKAVFSLIRKHTFIGTLQDTLQEEGMQEVDNELRTGSYSWAGVAYRTAVRTAGEVTQLNAALRLAANLQEDVYAKEAEARSAQEDMVARLRSRTLAADASLEDLRRELIRLELAPDASSEENERERARLRALHETGMRGMRDLGKKMLMKLGAEDRDVQNIYKRSRIAENALRSDLLEARLIHLAAGRDPMRVETWNELSRLRRDYRKEVEDFRAATKALHANREDAEDPLVREMMAKLRHMKQTADALEAVKFDIRDLWQQEVEQERKTRADELRGYEQRVRSEAAKLPPGVAADDQALVVEMDDLVRRQQKGEIPADADLVKLAGEAVARDIRYRELVRRQRAGELPADADLLALLDGPSESPAVPPAEALAGMSSETITVPDLADPDVPGLPDFEPAVPVTEPVPYAATPKVEVLEGPDGSRVQSQMINGQPHGLRIRWESGVMQASISYLNGRQHGPARTYRKGLLVSEGFFRDGKPHGPMRSLFENGSVESEAWQAEGRPHGWQRRWDRDGTLLSESLILSGVTRYERKWSRAGGEPVARSEVLRAADGRELLNRERSPDGTLLKEVLRQDPPPPAGPAELVREWNALARSYSETRRDRTGRPAGVQITFGAWGQAPWCRTEREFDGERGLVRERRVLPDATVVFECTYKTIDGTPRRHGTWRERSNDGSMRSAEYRDGLLHGAFTAEFPDGKPRVRGTFSEGRRHGEWSVAETDREPGIQVTYSRDLPNGPASELRSRKKVRELTLVNGACIEVRNWDDQGHLRLHMKGELKPLPAARVPEVQKDADPEAGGPPRLPFQQLSSGEALVTGTLQLWEVSAAGELFLSSVVERRNGKLHGTQYGAYLREGTRASEVTFVDGVQEGICRSWRPDGAFESEVTFRKGVPHGRGRWMDRASGRILEGTLTDGVLTGWWTTYHPNGTVRGRLFYLPLSPEQHARRPSARSASHTSPPTHAGDFGLQAGPWKTYEADGRVAMARWTIPDEAKPRHVDEAEFRAWLAGHPEIQVPLAVPE